MTNAPIRIGLVGFAAGLSWSSTAHLPAISALPQDFTLTGIANTSLESSKRGAEAAGVDKAYASPQEMFDDPDIDAVSITVKVPHHHELSLAALQAGKHVYCEWPLTQTAAEAAELAELAASKGLVAVAGCQARIAPQILHLRQLLAEGFLGEVLSSNLRGYGLNWGPTISLPERRGYMLDHASGANLLTIPLGHTMAGVQDVLGRAVTVSAEMPQRRKEVRAIESGEMVPLKTPDEVLIAATLESGAPLSIHYTGGMPRGLPGLCWDIHGTEGDLRLTAPVGHMQMAPLTLAGARGEATDLAEIATPDAFCDGIAGAAMPGNVIRNYKRMARDIRNGSKTSTSFADAEQVHILLEAVEAAAKTGERTSVDSTLTPVPLV